MPRDSFMESASCKGCCWRRSTTSFHSSLSCFTRSCEGWTTLSSVRLFAVSTQLSSWCSVVGPLSYLWRYRKKVPSSKLWWFFWNLLDIYKGSKESFSAQLPSKYTGSYPGPNPWAGNPQLKPSIALWICSWSNSRRTSWAARSTGNQRQFSSDSCSSWQKLRALSH